jgi:hypothetical protein
MLIRCRFTVEELDYWKAGDVVVPDNASLTISDLGLPTVVTSPPTTRICCRLGRRERRLTVSSLFAFFFFFTTEGLDCSGKGGCELPAPLQKARHHEPHPRRPNGCQSAASSALSRAAARCLAEGALSRWEHPITARGGSAAASSSACKETSALFSFLFVFPHFSLHAGGLLLLLFGGGQVWAPIRPRQQEARREREERTQ